MIRERENLKVNNWLIFQVLWKVKCNKNKIHHKKDRKLKENNHKRMSRIMIMMDMNDRLIDW